MITPDPPSPRAVVSQQALLATLVAVLLTTAGCATMLAGSGPAKFEASPASVSEKALSDTGFEQTTARWKNLSRTIEAAGQTREIQISNYVTAYRHTLANTGVTRGGFAVLTTPQAKVAGQAMNPVKDWDDEKIINELSSGFAGNYGTIQNMETTGESSVSILGKKRTVTELTAEAKPDDGNATKVKIYVAKFKHSGDIVIAGGVHSTIDSKERGRIMTMLKNIEH
jgi:hypothetical protein